MGEYVQQLRSKLRQISEHEKQLWVVAYVNQPQDKPQNLKLEAMKNVEASLEGGADAVILINEWCTYQELESTIRETKKEFPKLKLGVNYLGDEKDEPYGFQGSFQLAKEYDLDIVWTDFSGVDEINEKPLVNLHEIERYRYEKAFYCSGVHMKYSTLKNPQKSIVKSSMQAMGWVDGIILTGEKTGVAVNTDKVKSVFPELNGYPLGVASGVNAQNVEQILPYMDFFIVSSSLQGDNHRIVTEKVRLLKQTMLKNKNFSS